MCLNASKDISNFKETLKIKTLYDPQDIKSLILLGALEFIKFPERDSALEYLQKAIKLDPGNVDARFWYGVCLYRRFSEPEKAEVVLSTALKLDSNRSDCLSLMADIHWGKKNFEVSLEFLRKAVQISPNWPMLRVELVYLLINLGQFKEAECEIENAAELLKQDVRIPENEVEHYYENTVTGRSWTNVGEKLDRLRVLLMQNLSIAKDKSGSIF